MIRVTSTLSREAAAKLIALAAKTRWLRTQWAFTLAARPLDAAELARFAAALDDRRALQLCEVLGRIEDREERRSLSLEAMLTRFLPAAPVEANLALFDSKVFHARTAKLEEARARARDADLGSPREPEVRVQIDAKILGLVSRARRLVFMLGAGISAGAGIATYRGSGRAPRTEDSLPQLMTLPYYLENPDVVWAHVLELRSMIATKRATAAHRALAAIARRADCVVTITQNVDGFERMVGLESVITLHGQLAAHRCMKEGADVDAPDPRYNDASFPICPRDGALLKPGMVFFFEGIDARAFDRALDAIAECDLLIEIGTSHVVYPARHFWQYALKKGAKVLCVNTQVPDAIRAAATAYVEGDAQEILPAIARALVISR